MRTLKMEALQGKADIEGEDQGEGEKTQYC